MLNGFTLRVTTRSNSVGVEIVKGLKQVKMQVCINNEGHCKLATGVCNNAEGHYKVAIGVCNNAEGHCKVAIGVC